MFIECQWHDDARCQKRNIQHGEHRNRNMAQTAMAYLSTLMVERRFESRSGIGMGKFVGNRQGDAAAERYLGTVMATI